MEYDIIVIGSGPAGVTASIYAKRANMNVLVISKGKGTLQKAKKLENYYGFVEPISGEELETRGIEQAKRLGIEIKQDEVLNISYNENFEIETVNSKYIAKKVIMATGNSRKKPNIKGIAEFEGKGISYCAVCDGYFFRNKNVAVLGSREYAMHEAEELTSVTKNVTILTNGEKIVENRSNDLPVNEKEIRELRGGKKLEEVEFTDNSTQKIDGLFVAIGTASSSDLAKKLGVLLDKNENIIIDRNMQTNIKGLFACGDCTGGPFQISKGVYEGMSAALSAIKQLKEEKIKTN